MAEGDGGSADGEAGHALVENRVAIAVARRALLAPLSARNCAYHKFSKVSALFYVACKGPMGTFEKL